MPQWFFDQTNLNYATGIGIPNKPKLATPKVLQAELDGKAPVTKSQKKGEKSEVRKLKISRAWDIALGSAKSIPISLVVAYFSGNSLQIVTISMVLFSFFINPIKQILQSNQTFGPLKTNETSGSVRVAQGIYIAFNIIAILFGFWKVGQMGLLPTHASDWVQWESRPDLGKKIHFKI